MSSFGKEYLKYPELKTEIKKIQRLFSDRHFRKVVRTRACYDTDFIAIPLPDYIDKTFYVLNHIAATTDAKVEIDGIKSIGYDFREIDKLSFLSSAAGDKLYYQRSPLKYPHLWEHLVANNKFYATANELQLLFEKYGTTPSVFYADPIVKLRQQVNDFRKQHQIRIDDIYGECFRNGEVDVKWLSEYNLYRLVLEVFPDAIFQYSPQWLRPQSLDIYIDVIQTAIEYQGKQHYEPVDYFGGVPNFEKTVVRDDKKKQLCIAHGIKLYYWKYDIPITNENLIALLAKPPDL